MSEPYRRLLEPLSRRIKLMLTRAVGKLVDPSTLLQQLQVEALKGEILDQIEHLEGYGRTANPPEGWEALVASLGGDRAHSVVISAFHRQFRIKNLAAGEVAIYDDQGQVIQLKRNKEIHVYGCDQLTADVGTQADINCPVVNASGDLNVGGNLTVAGRAAVTGAISGGSGGSFAGDVSDSKGTMQAMRDVHNTHDHPGDSGGTTGEANQKM